MTYSFPAPFRPMENQVRRWRFLLSNRRAFDRAPTTPQSRPVSPRIRIIMALDVWEHAYYLDHQNRRQAYVEAFFDHLANWHFAEANLNGLRVGA
mgnify:CR=1 FL=1